MNIKSPIEWISEAWREGQAYFASLGPLGLALNAGLSLLLLLFAALGSAGVSAGMRAIVKKISDPKGDGEVGAKGGGANVAANLVIWALWLATFAMVLSVWGLDIWRWAGGDGGPIITGAGQILLVVAAAAIAWEFSSRAIDIGFRRAVDRADATRRAAQLRTLAPMLRGVVQSVIALFAGLVIASQFGVKIGPLLAGAGVVGVAVGFGAQTLVKDYLTGFSLILEDIVSVGDIVRIGNCGGLVETMTLRTIRLRDFDGTLHVIPYSEAQIVRNLTKTFSYYVFNIPISYDADIDEALRIMRRVGDELRGDLKFSQSILEPIEVVGVDSLADSAVVLKARIKTLPLQQWNVGREYNRRIKLAFDAAGVEIPVPHMKLLLSQPAIEAMQAR